MRTGFRYAFGLRSLVQFYDDTPNEKDTLGCPFRLEAPPGIEPGIEVLQTFALPLGHSALFIFIKIGYDYSYPVWSGLRGSNPPPSPWQGDALPNELNPHMVPPVGIEPTTRLSC